MDNSTDSDELTTEDRQLLADVLQLMGVVGDPTLAQFTQACRIIERVICELKDASEAASRIH
jgi:hypothetical protein